MDQREFDRELRKWLAKPPGESVGDVIERLLAAPPEKQTEVTKAISKLLREGWDEPSRAPGRMTLERAHGLAWLAFAGLVLLGAEAQLCWSYVELGLALGTVTPATAARVMRSFKDLYDSTERLYAPLIDKLFEFEARQANAKIATLETLEACEDKVFSLELRAASVPRVAS